MENHQGPSFHSPKSPAKSCSPQRQKLEAYDEDAKLSVDILLADPRCNGRIGTTGMCLGGHLAYRCALDARVSAAVCYFATDIHSHSLGAGKNDDSLARARDIKAELVMVRPSFPHLPLHPTKDSFNLRDRNQGPEIFVRFYEQCKGLTGLSSQLNRSSARKTTTSRPQAAT